MIPAIFDLSLFAHVVQTAGILLLCVLFTGLYRLSPRRYFSFWVKGWWFLLIAMLGLQVYFRFYAEFPWAQMIYYWGEYCFTFYMGFGALSYPDRKIPEWIKSYQIWLISLVPAAGIYFGFDTFDDRFVYHSFLFACLLMAVAICLWRIALPEKARWARFIPVFSLVVLSMMFMANSMHLFTPELMGDKANTIYVAYQSIFDVLVEFLLAFGLILLAAVNVQIRLKRLHLLLQTEKDKMALLAHMDSLTDCFNRHALEKFIPRFNRKPGLLFMIDLNDLKKINDQFGHQAGDRVIQLVSKTIKESLRLDDYFFRFGGDEFLLVSYGMSDEAADKRMQEIQARLLALAPQNPDLPIATVSWGIAGFEQDSSFEAVMRLADHKLYEHKMASRHSI